MLGYLSLANIWSLFTLVLDVGLTAIVIYYVLKIVRTNTRTIQIFKGILFLFFLNGIAQILSLSTIEYFTSQFMTWGWVALIIVFQPEIRSLLEKVGKTPVFSRTNTLTVNEREHLVEELVKTCSALSSTKTGAIISIEQGQSLSDYIKTGTSMNSLVSSELLRSIFQYGTPLHDGAVIIQGNKIACASAYFPPTTKDFPSSYGARHRAAVGISEISDCVTIIVSEETGNISIAREGALLIMTPEELQNYLLMTICKNDQVVVKEEVGKTTVSERLHDAKSLKDLFSAAEKKSEFTTLKRYSKKRVGKNVKKSEESEFEKIEAEEIVVLPKKKRNRKRPVSQHDEEGGEA